jgi:hypothetical protein
MTELPRTKLLRYIQPILLLALVIGIVVLGGKMVSSDKSQPSGKKPAYVTQMEAAYGGPSQNSFGSGVFFENLSSPDALDKAARQKYQFFVGPNWERFGEEAWMSAWKLVYTRPAGATPDIVTELSGIPDPDAVLSAPMILDVVENPGPARQALAAAFDDPSVTELTVYNLGDGAAMSGLLVAGRRGNGDAVFFVFIYD